MIAAFLVGFAIGCILTACVVAYLMRDATWK